MYIFQHKNNTSSSFLKFSVKHNRSKNKTLLLIYSKRVLFFRPDYTYLLFREEWPYHRNNDKGDNKADNN